jgi:hypothetical protein
MGKVGDIRFPKNCCICLAPNPEKVKEVSATFEIPGGTQFYSVYVPMCNQCLKKRQTHIWISWSGIFFFILIGVALYLIEHFGVMSIEITGRLGIVTLLGGVTWIISSGVATLFISTYKKMPGLSVYKGEEIGSLGGNYRETFIRVVSPVREFQEMYDTLNPILTYNDYTKGFYKF